MMTDQKLENARRGDTSQLEALVEEVRRLRESELGWKALNEVFQQDCGAAISEMFKTQAELASARAEITGLKAACCATELENEQLRKKLSEERWICENPECRSVYPEYVNGCPRCYDKGLHFSVRCPTLYTDLAAARAEVERAHIERDNWQRDTERHINNAQFYRGIVVKIGEMFGDAAKIQDDGGTAEEVLCLKVPDLVERLKRENETLRKEHEAVMPILGKSKSNTGWPWNDLADAHRAAQAMLESSHG